MVVDARSRDSEGGKRDLWKAFPHSKQSSNATLWIKWPFQDGEMQALQAWGMAVDTLWSAIGTCCHFEKSMFSVSCMIFYTLSRLVP